MSNNPSGPLTLGIKDCLSTGNFSDLSLICGEKTFKVHKIVLYAQSAYFKGLLAGDVKEAGQNVIELKGDDPDVMAVLVCFMCHFTFDEALRGDTALLPFCVYVNAAAGKYALPALQQQALNKFKVSCKSQLGVDDVVATVHAIDENTADRTLWDIILPAIRHNIKALLRSSAFFELVLSMPALNLELLAMLGESYHAENDEFLQGSSVAAASKSTRGFDGRHEEEAEDDPVDRAGSSGWRGRGGYYNRGRRLGDG